MIPRVQTSCISYKPNNSFTISVLFLSSYLDVFKIGKMRSYQDWTFSFEFLKTNLSGGAFPNPRIPSTLRLFSNGGINIISILSGNSVPPGGSLKSVLLIILRK